MRFVDLFSGMGGFRLALESTRNSCVFSADFDRHACETYEKNFGTFPLGDVSKIDEREIPSHDLLTAGFPCQPFSIAGYRRGFEDTRGTLFFDVLRILRHHRPSSFILENVRGLISHDAGRTFGTILNSLAEEVNGLPNASRSRDNLGYFVFWKILNAKDFGVPQNRERVFIVGFRQRPSSFEFPSGLKSTPSLLSILDERPVLRRLSNQSHGYVEKYLKLHPRYREVRNLPFLIAYEIRKSRTAFRFDDLSPCLTTKMGTGGNNVPYLVNQRRFLSLSECLQIQGFPSSFELTGSYNHALRQIGNSVAVPVVKSVFQSMRSSLAI